MKTGRIRVTKKAHTQEQEKGDQGAQETEQGNRFQSSFSTFSRKKVKQQG